MSKHTIVQHSGFGYQGDTAFQLALESRTVSRMQEAKVEKAGGLLFDDYTAAEDYAMEEQYREGSLGMIPRAPGTFSDTEIDGLAVYVPKDRPAAEPLRLVLTDRDGTVVASTETTYEEFHAAREGSSLLGRLKEPVRA